MKNLVIIFITFLFLFSNVNAQSLWLVDYGYDAQCNYLVENLSVDSLENIVLTDDWGQLAGIYECAVTRLYYFHKETESQFLINNLNTEIDSTTTPLWAIGQEWQKFYVDAYILGLLGSPIAIEKMRVISNDENNSYRLYAIGHLAEAGYYEQYDFLIGEYYSGIKDPYILNLLGWYSRSENYRDEIKTILRNEVYSESDYFGVISKAHNLSFIPGAEVEILDEFFRSTTGKERYDYFFHIGIYDKDGQPERSMFALQNEVNDTFRVEYLPSPDMVISWNSISKRYLEPMFINFLKGLNITDPSLMTYQRREFFLLAFVPVPPDSTKPTLDLLDNLYNYVDSVSFYTWLDDLQFKNELQSIIQSAKSSLQAGDSVACAVKVKDFQDNVDLVYKDSLNADPRFVTIEGWKFLYWNAQYILDRLPEIPIILPPDIEVINPAMSLVNPGAFTMEVKGTVFTTNSVVYFNGNARATTFVSDSVLNTQILSTDVSVAGNFPVWVSDNTLNSDTLIYKVVSILPQPVRPVLECVTNNGNGTYTAFFGYKNENSVSVYIPVGSKNKFTPNPQDRGQTRVFKPGRQIKVYTVNFNGSNLVWTLNGRTSTASANSAPCQ